jgi:hypothetical protein
LKLQKKNFLNFFQRIYCPPSLILEKISIFHQNLRCMFWMIIVNLIGVLPHAGYQNVSPGLGEPISGKKIGQSAISGQIIDLYFLTIFDKKFWFFIKNGRFGQFGRPIGRYHYTQINRPLILSTKKLKISHNS